MKKEIFLVGSVVGLCGFLGVSYQLIFGHSKAFMFFVKCFSNNLFCTANLVILLVFLVCWLGYEVAISYKQQKLLQKMKKAGFNQ